MWNTAGENAGPKVSGISPTVETSFKMLLSRLAAEYGAICEENTLLKAKLGDNFLPEWRTCSVSFATEENTISKAKLQESLIPLSNTCSEPYISEENPVARARSELSLIPESIRCDAPHAYELTSKSIGMNLRKSATPTSVCSSTTTHKPKEELLQEAFMYAHQPFKDFKQRSDSEDGMHGSDEQVVSTDFPGLRRGFTQILESCRVPFFHKAETRSSMDDNVENDNLSKIGKCLESDTAEVIVAFLIITNTIVMAIELQWKGTRAGHFVGYPGYSRSGVEAWRGAGDWFRVIETTFTVVFTIELAVRLIVLRFRMLTVATSWLDVFSVAISLFDWFASQKGESLFNPMMARMVRLVKLLRLTRGIRIIRIARMLSSLHLILRSIQASLSTLSWSVLVLLVVQCIAGMTFSQLVYGFIIDEDQDLEARQLAFEYYGTFTRSMITMFEVHLANFSPACRALVDTMGEGYAYIFLAYRCLVGFAVLHVISAVFIQQTMKVSQQDHDVMLAQKHRSAQKYSAEIRRLFEALDKHGSGSISMEELEIAIQTQPTMKLWMDALEIDTHDLDALFRIIDTNGDQVITFDELISAASRIKGGAKSVDIITLAAQMSIIHKKLHITSSRVKTLRDAIIGARHGPSSTLRRAHLQSSQAMSCVDL